MEVGCGTPPTLHIAELKGNQGPLVDNSGSRLLQLHGSLLGLVFSFLEGQDRKAFLSVCRDTRSDAVLSQITTLDIDLAKGVPQGPLRFPKGARLLSLNILGDFDSTGLDKLMFMWFSWRGCERARGILGDLEELSIVECDVETEAMARVLADNVAFLCPKLAALSICRSLVHASLFQGLAACGTPLTELHMCHSSIDANFAAILKRLPHLSAVSLHVCGEPAQLAAISMLGDKLTSLQVYLSEDSAPFFCNVLRASPNLESVQVDSLNSPTGIDWSSPSMAQLNFTALSVSILPDLLAAQLPLLQSVQADALLVTAMAEEEAASLAAELERFKAAMDSLQIDCASEGMLVGSSMNAMEARHLLQALRPLIGTKLMQNISSVKAYNVTFGAGDMAALAPLFPNVERLWLGRSRLHPKSLVEAVQAFSKLDHLDVAEKKGQMLLHHEGIMAACTCAQLSNRAHDLKVRMVVRSDRSFGEAPSSDPEDEEASEEGEGQDGLLRMSDVMPQCLLISHWEEVAPSLGRGPSNVQLILDAPTVAAVQPR